MLLVCDVANRGLFQMHFWECQWETTVLRRKYSAMVLINGLANGLSKSILKTPHRKNKQHKKLDFHYRGTLSNFTCQVNAS